jgi:hypothetical protein
MGKLVKEEEPVDKQDESRRKFVKKMVYVPPAILTLAAAPSFAKNGSHKEPKPPKDPKPLKDHKPPKWP